MSINTENGTPVLSLYFKVSHELLGSRLNFSAEREVKLERTMAAFDELKKGVDPVLQWCALQPLRYILIILDYFLALLGISIMYGSKQEQEEHHEEYQDLR